jgi:beta-1,4-N-acetylglucosaminyltransferase
MIFVTVGTGKFELLVKEIDKIASKLGERVIIQVGKGKYEPKNCEFFRFSKNLERYYKKASIVIAHGGAGTTYELLKIRKKLISMANLDRTDTHQQEILRALSEENYLIWCKNSSELFDYIKKVKNFKFKKYKVPECKIHEKIKSFLK